MRKNLKFVFIFICSFHFLYAKGLIYTKGNPATHFSVDGTDHKHNHKQSKNTYKPPTMYIISGPDSVAYGQTVTYNVISQHPGGSFSFYQRPIKWVVANATITNQDATHAQATIQWSSTSDPQPNAVLIAKDFAKDSIVALLPVKISLPAINVGYISPMAQTLQYNATPASLSLPAATGGVFPQGPFTYQWQFSADNGVTWNSISGATALSYNPGNVINNAIYSVVITNHGQVAYSPTATITVPLLQNSITPSSKTINYNASPGALTCSPTHGGYANIPYTYQWQQSFDNSNWANIPGATSLSYTPGNLIFTTYYRVVTNQNNDSIYSNTVTVTVTGGISSPTIVSSSLTGTTIDLSKPVGTPNGSPQVGDGGTAGYIIPIEALPGTNKMQPNVSLMYSSSGNAADAGWGWQLSAFSQITRQGKSLYYNGTTSPISFTDSSDAFALDGQRLFPVSGANGDNGTIYGQENENYSKIQSFGGSQSAGPDYFTVTTKDGTILEYGKTPDTKFLTDNGQSTMVWLLDKITDKNGNYETFSYLNDNTNRTYVLTEIDYTGNAAMGLAPYNKMKFNYVPRSNWYATTKYLGGASLKNPYLLNGITITNNSGAIEKAYKCAYYQLNGEYFLKTFTESGSDGSGFNPLVFSYGSNTGGPHESISPAFTGLTSNNTLFAGNFEGNGIDGIVQAHYSYDNNNDVHYTSYDMLNTLSSYAGATSIEWNYHAYFNGSNNYIPVKNNSDFSILANDYDGDGKTDVLFANYGLVGDNDTINKIQINFSKRLYAEGDFYTYDSAIYTNKPVVSGYSGNFKYLNSSFIIPGDFDGDGAQDYILILGLNATNQFKAFFNSPKKGILNQEISGFGIGGASSDPFYANTIASISPEDIVPMDFDGDGKTDIMVRTNTGSYILTINAATNNTYLTSQICYTAGIVSGDPIFLGDFNGDGKSDLLIRNSIASDQWQLYYSTGKLFNIYPFVWANNPILEEDGAPSFHLISISDLNGDGRSDIWQSLDVAGKTIHHMYLSEGEPAGGQNSSSSFLIVSDTTTSSLNSTETPICGDFNGDGKIDVGSIQNSNLTIVYPEPGKEDHLMVKAVNGLGSESDYDYSILNNNVYTISDIYNYDTLGKPPGKSLNGNPYNVLNSGPIRVVRLFTTPDKVVSYSYQDAVFSPLRGFLGFKQFSSFNQLTGIKTINFSDVDTKFLVPKQIKQTSADKNGNPLSETYITDTLLSVSTSAADKRFVHQLKKQINLNELTGAGSETDNTYDNYGNVTTQTVKTGSYSGTIVSPTLTTTTVTVYGTYGAASVPSYPTSVTASSTRSGKPAVSKQTTFTYDAKGNPSTSVRFAGTANAVTTTYKYDLFGNDTSAVVSAAGINNRVSGITMDAQGRFALRTRQTGSGITKTQLFTYNDWGSPLTQKSAAGLTTSQQYDAFNRPTITTTPEGYNITLSYAWESTTGRFSVTTSQPGGGSNTKIWYDILGRVIQKQVSGYNGQNLIQNNTYNALGQLAGATKPHYSAEAATTINYTYDNDNRVTKITTPINYVSYAYSAAAGGQYKVTTTSSAGQSSSKTTDATGAVISATDNGGTVSFSYDSWGNQLTASAGGKTMITNVYNSYGQKTATTDINIGAYSYQYDGLGQLIKQTDPLNHVYNLTYDDFGRLLTKAGAEGTTTYTYYNNITTGYSSDQVAKIIGFSGEETDYTYDNLMRPQTKKITIGGTAYTTAFGYDTYSDPVSVTYPDGLVINSSFDNNGILTKKTMQSGATTTTLFTASAMNSAGVYTGYSLGNGKTSQVTFDLTAGKPTRYYTPGLQDLNFVFDPNTGNLSSRKDAINNLTETFTYDNLNRLTGSSLNNVVQQSLQYDNASGTSFGNITQKSDAGNYVYNTSKINQVSYITDTGSNTHLPPPNISQNAQTIGYTPFLMTDSVAQNGNVVHFTYAYDDNRIKSVLSVGGVVSETRYFLGDFEVQVKGGVTRYIHYISAGNGLGSIITSQGGTVTPYYVYGDYLGSILTVTDASGNPVAQQNFDAWGRNRNPGNWTYSSIPAVPDWLYRGYTGHEMLPQFALVNMNGRMYDPVIGKMLAPDINIPNPYSAVGYNRYDYAFNNPLLFTDPTGELTQAQLDALWNNPHGGYWENDGSPDGKIHLFESVYQENARASLLYQSELEGSMPSGFGGFDGGFGGGFWPAGRIYTTREMNAISRYYANLLQGAVNGSFGLLNGYDLKIDNLSTMDGLNIGWSFSSNYVVAGEDVFLSTKHLSGQQVDNLLQNLGVDEPKEQGNSFSFEKGIGVTDLAVDSHNLSVDGAAALSKNVANDFKPLLKVGARIGGGLGVITAGYDMYKNGATVSNVTSMTLATASIVLSFVPGVDVLVWIVDAATIIKDAHDLYQDSKEGD